MAPPKSNEKKIRQRCEMGCSRAAAKSALRASKWDFEEAASAVWDDKHADAADVPTDDEDDQLQSTSQQSLHAASLLTSAAPSSVHSPSTSAFVAAVPESRSSAKGKGRAHEPGESSGASARAHKLPTPAADASDAEMDAVEGEDEDEDKDNDDEEMASYSNADVDGYDGGAGGAVLDDEDDGDDLESQADSVDYGDGDAYGFLNISKDRTETIKEVEEPVKKVIVSQMKRGEYADIASAPDSVEAELFGFQRWISGCPEGNEQQQLFSLYTDLSGEAFVPAKCPHNCGSLVPHSASDFFAIPADADFFSYIKRLAAVVLATCDTCKGGICLACNEACAITPVEPGSVKRDAAPEVLLHCPNLQALILGVGLFIAEQLWSGESAADRQEAAASGSKKRKAGSPDVDSAASAVSTSSYEYARTRAAPYKAGTGYGGARGNESDAGVKTALKAQQEKDKALATHLALVRVYLPNRDRPGPFRHSDHMPAGQTLAHLRRRFNPIASQLLSAESLSDMSERKELYTEFMAWLEVMSAHENLAGLMGQPIMRVASVTYSEAASASTASRGREKVIVFEASVGPRELLEKILAQVKIAQKVSMAAKARELALQGANGQGANGQGASGLAAPGTSTTAALYTDNGAGSSASTAGAQEAGRLMEFCETIIKAVGKIDRALKQSKRGEAVLKTLRVDVNGGNSKKKNGAAASDGEADNVDAGSAKYDDMTDVSDEQLKKTYVEWASEARYAEYNWEVEPAEGASTSELGPSYKHTYSKEAKSISSYPGRNVAIMKEHTALAHNLPVNWDSSVFLRGDAGRPDVLKALIIGPDGTPYENGCFIFDILLGGNYNQGPPNVSCKTTKGDRYRLNPNLYACGKVCLSLLGTWSGPGWVPGKSTLLQVLISIQSMILWAEPITNEPGFEHDLGSARSKAYNFNVRRMVVHIAMLEYLRSPPEGFEEIILQHFRLKSRAIRAQLDKWIAEDDGSALHHDSMNAIRGSSSSAALAAPAAQAAGTSSAAGAAFRADVEAVKGYLVRLEKGEDIFAEDAARPSTVSSSSSASAGTKKAKTKAKK